MAFTLLLSLNNSFKNVLDKSISQWNNNGTNT